MEQRERRRHRIGYPFRRPRRLWRKNEVSVEISLILLKETVKLFLIMLMGFALIRTGKLRSSDGKALSVLLVYLILPCVIIHSFQVEPSEAVRRGLLFAFGAAVAVHALFIILTAAFRPLFSLKAVEQMALIYTNAGILVFPLVTALLGPDYLIYPCASRLLPAVRARGNPYPQHRLQHQYPGYMLRRSPLSAAYFPAASDRPDPEQRRLHDRPRRHAHYGHGYCRLRFEGNLRQASCLFARRPAARRISCRPGRRPRSFGCGVLHR